MPKTKSTSSTKKASKTKSTSKKKAPVKKKTTTKSRSTKTGTKKKTTKRVSATKKTTAKKRRTTKKVVKKSIPVRVESEKKQLHVFPKKRTLINQLPVIDLDELHVSSMKIESKGETIEQVTIHSRLAFYLGVFMGAVVVNAFLVTVLAVMSV